MIIFRAVKLSAALFFYLCVLIEYELSFSSEGTQSKRLSGPERKISKSLGKMSIILLICKWLVLTVMGRYILTRLGNDVNGGVISLVLDQLISVY
jgi:hypothetical protein